MLQPWLYPGKVVTSEISNILRGFNRVCRRSCCCLDGVFIVALRSIQGWQLIVVDASPGSSESVWRPGITDEGPISTECTGRRPMFYLLKCARFDNECQ